MSAPSIQTQAQPRPNGRLPVYQWRTTGFKNTSSVQTSNHVDGKEKEKSMVTGLEIAARNSVSTTTFEISTDPTLIPAETLNSFFASDDMSWAQPLPEEQISILIQESVCFGIYEIGPGQNHNDHDLTSDRDDRPDGGKARYIDPTTSSSPSHRTLIGFARWITDHVTVVYLTDVYILPEYRGRGLAKWLLACVDQAFQDMDYCRGFILVTNRGSKEANLYRRVLLMDEMDHPAFLMHKDGRGKETASARRRVEDVEDVEGGRVDGVTTELSGSVERRR